MIFRKFQFFSWWKVHLKSHYILKIIFCWTNHYFPCSFWWTESNGKQKEHFYAEKHQEKWKIWIFRKAWPAFHNYCKWFLYVTWQKTDTKIIYNSCETQAKLSERNEVSIFLHFFSIKMFLLLSIRFSSSEWTWKIVICSTKNYF